MEFLLNDGPAKGAPTGDLIKDGDTASFMQDVIEMSMTVPVIVDFWATWCGPCKTLGPLLEKHVKAAKGAVRMVKIDVDRNQDLAAQMRIQSVPSVYAFSQGRPVDGFTGAQPESQIKAFIARLAQGGGESGLDEALAQAAELLAAGDAASAHQLYQQILREDNANAPAFGGLLRTMLALGQEDQAQDLLARLPPEIAKHADVAAVRTSLELAAQASQSGPAEALAAAVAADAGNHQARYDLALALFAAGHKDQAIEHLLEIVRRDRAWNEDGARKQLLRLMEAIGYSDPLSVATRKRLSSLLFS